MVDCAGTCKSLANPAFPINSVFFFILWKVLLVNQSSIFSDNLTLVSYIGINLAVWSNILEVFTWQKAWAQSQLEMCPYSSRGPTLIQIWSIIPTFNVQLINICSHSKEIYQYIAGQCPKSKPTLWSPSPSWGCWSPEFQHGQDSDPHPQRGSTCTQKTCPP